MDDAGKMTLGDYLSDKNPHEDRIRGRYLSRQMIEEEFEAIWEKQREFHPDLMTEEAKKEVHHYIFFQRPLKSQKKLIAFCALEPEERRASRATWIAQTSRVVQEVNNLRIIAESGKERDLEAEERAKVLAKLSTTKGDVKFETLRKLLGLGELDHFNLEAGDRNKLKGHVVEATLAKDFKKRWEADREKLLEIWDAFVEMEPEDFIEIVQNSDVDPLTEVGDDDEPGKYSLSFEREEFEKLKDLILEDEE